MDSKKPKKGNDKKFHTPETKAVANGTSKAKNEGNRPVVKASKKKEKGDTESATTPPHNGIENEQLVDKETLAAELIQKRMRGALGRKMVNDLKSAKSKALDEEKQTAAARLIQKRARGAIARKNVKTMTEQSKEDAEVNAAKLIQKYARGTIARKVVTEKKLSLANAKKDIVIPPTTVIPEPAVANPSVRGARGGVGVEKKLKSVPTSSKPGNKQPIPPPAVLPAPIPIPGTEDAGSIGASVSEMTPTRLRKKRPLYMRIIAKYHQQTNAVEEEKARKYKEYMEFKAKNNPSRAEIRAHMAKIDREKAEKEAIRLSIAQDMEVERQAKMEKRERKRLLRLHATLEEASKYKSPLRRKVRKDLFGNIIPEEDGEEGSQAHEIHTASSEGTNNPRGNRHGQPEGSMLGSKSVHEKHRRVKDKESPGLHLPSIDYKLPVFVTEEEGSEAGGGDPKSRKVDNTRKKPGKRRGGSEVSPFKKQIKEELQQQKALPGILEAEKRQRVAKKKEYGMKTLELHPPVDFCIMGNINLPTISNMVHGSPGSKLYQKQLMLQQAKALEEGEYHRDDQAYVQAMIALTEPSNSSIPPFKHAMKSPGPAGSAVGAAAAGSVGKKKAIQFTDNEEEIQIRGFDSPRSERAPSPPISTRRADVPPVQDDFPESASHLPHPTAPVASKLQEHLMSLAKTATAAASMPQYQGQDYIASLTVTDAEQEEQLHDVYINGFTLLMQE